MNKIFRVGIIAIVFSVPVYAGTNSHATGQGGHVGHSSVHPTGGKQMNAVTYSGTTPRHHKHKGGAGANSAIGDPNVLFGHHHHRRRHQLG
jgi:hypothetical protein